jgi:hypothetical protein
MCSSKLGEFEAEIDPRCDIDSLKNALTDSLSTVDDFKFCGIVASDRAAKLGLLVHADTDAGCHVN